MPPKSKRLVGRAWCVSLAGFALLSLAACGSKSALPVHPGFAPFVPRKSTITSSAYIKHVIIIIQENRSLDNLFNGYPGADTVQSGPRQDGSIVALKPTPLEAGIDVGHFHLSFLAAYNNGAMNGWDGENTFGITPKGYQPIPAPPDYEYGYVPQSEVQPYWQLAQGFTLADRMFQSNSGPSYPAHQYLIAAQSADADEVPSSGPWGCDAPAGTTVSLLGPNGNDIPGPFPCFDYQTLGDELDARNITWRYYAPQLNATGGLFSAYDAIRHIRYGPDWTTKVISPETTVLTDISAGSLQQVSWVVPSFPNSDHALAKSNTGPQWVSSIVNAVGASPYWNNTAILIMWDDWGGWYDHVSPSRLDPMGLGFRVPLLVVSPYAKHGYVSHVRHEFGSVLKFTEATFGLATLNTSDARADDLTDCFDFSQTVKPFKAVRTTLSRSFFLSQPRSFDPPDPY
ncbi:MAG: hypothetical protein GIW99_11725 [Candidatus Eremiobacteraeota bacterium]|nr:hypothetical protein [Candidatus Eremiobacteraeota bacterium]MBC5828329.1 hypothetical protein [Candidatus Eremiobacteraeota bacterium]